MIQLPKVKIPIKVGESEVTKPGLGRKMTACCPSSSSGWGNVIPSMFSLGKMFANCFRRRSFSSDWKISFLWECRRAYGQLLFQSSLHLLPSNSIYWKCKWKLNFQLSASEAIEAMKILYLRRKFPYVKFQLPILKTVDLLEEHTEEKKYKIEDFSPFLASDQKSKFMSQCKLHVFSLIFRAFLLLTGKIILEIFGSKTWCLSDICLHFLVSLPTQPRLLAEQYLEWKSWLRSRSSSSSYKFIIQWEIEAILLICCNFPVYVPWPHFVPLGILRNLLWFWFSIRKLNCLCMIFTIWTTTEGV